MSSKPVTRRSTRKSNTQSQTTKIQNKAPTPAVTPEKEQPKCRSPKIYVLTAKDGSPTICNQKDFLSMMQSGERYAVKIFGTKKEAELYVNSALKVSI